ncbi:MAG: hypothetical protein K0U98_17225 [Deltaproteobacteria bacterium]|nr:hypothetical protein [Deltaproteobacteria bacterium]
MVTRTVLLAILMLDPAFHQDLLKDQLKDLLFRPATRAPARSLLGTFLLAATVFSAAISSALFISATAFSPTVGAEELSAFEVLAELQERYQNFPAYFDRGTIEVEVVGQLPRRLAFLSRMDASGDFVFRLQPDLPDEKSFWRQGEEVRGWDRSTDAVRELDSLATEVSLSLGEGGQDTLLAPAWLLGSKYALEAPEAAAVDRRVCGLSSCRVLTLVRQGGALETELWVDLERGLLQVIEVRLFRPPEKLDVRGGAVGDEPQVARTLRLVFDRVEIGEDVVELATFTPPTAPVSGDRPEVSDPEDASLGQAPPAVFGDEISVALHTYQVRALGYDGAPLRGLKPENFSVRLEGENLKVVALDWVEAGRSPEADLPPEVLAELGITLPPPGRLLVLFVQAGFEPTRMRGHLKQVLGAKRFLDTLKPDDQVAVVSFDSHLKLHLDFTKDLERVEEVLGQAVRFRSKADPIEPGLYPSLARHFNFRQAKRAARPERALELTARAMQPLLGERIVVFLGWGVGEFVGGGVRLGRHYDRAVAAFAEAGVSVSVLDISEADFHSLEVGLKQIASDTGGTYERRFRLGGLAMDRLVRSLDGRYLLTFQVPHSVGTYDVRRLKIRLEGVKGKLTRSLTPLPR